jgi:hypothetical protein
VYSDCERYSISENVEAIGLEELAMELSEL